MIICAKLKSIFEKSDMFYNKKTINK